jgi:hypothetical protein
MGSRRKPEGGYVEIAGFAVKFAARKPEKDAYFFPV